MLLFDHLIQTIVAVSSVAQTLRKQELPKLTHMSSPLNHERVDVAQHTAHYIILCMSDARRPELVRQWLMQ